MNPDNQLPRPNGPVMDVQRPRPNPAPSEVTTPLDNPMAPADSITNLTPDPGQVIGQQPLQQTTQPKPKKKHTGLIVAIVTITVIVLVGAGVGAFIWYKNSHKPAPVAPTAQTETERVNVEEVDATTAAIDKTLNTLNDSSDVTSNDVTDNSLGL
jgi:uncharacterized protein HemX